MLLTPSQARAAYQHALAEGYALLAVNADSPAAVTDALEAAREAEAPIIVEASLWQLTGRSFGAGDADLGLLRYLAQMAALAQAPRYRHLPVLFHTDHIKGPLALPLLQRALAGLELRGADASLLLAPSSISLDSSSMSEPENVAAACALCAEADRLSRPLTLELEAGVDDGVSPVEVADRILGPVESAHPGRIALWAPGVGTQHGLGGDGYPSFSPAAVAAHRERASALCQRPIGIALHGSSGLPDESLRAAVRAGVCKVNWSSESLLLRSTAAADYYRTQTAELDKAHPRWKATAMDHGVQSSIAARYVPAVVRRIEILGAAGRAAALSAALAV